MENKLKSLLTTWPAGTIKTAKTLSQNNHYSRQLLHMYCQAGWLIKMGNGIFAKAGDQVGWAGAVAALETELNCSIRLGGLSALELHGLGQYVGFNELLYLYNTGAKKYALPTWFRVFIKKVIYIQRHLFENSNMGFVSYTTDNITILISSPERALLEMLALVPDKMSFQHAFEIMENARLLEPKLVQILLENCRSIKVKRLFLYMADTHQLPSFNHLNLSKINLGSGERVIGKGGSFNSKYLLSVPRSFDDESGNHDV